MLKEWFLLLTTISFFSCNGEEGGIGCTGTTYTHVKKGTGLLKQENNLWINDTARTIEFVFKGNVLKIEEAIPSLNTNTAWIDQEQEESNGCINSVTIYEVATNIEEKRSTSAGLPVAFIETRVKDFTGANKTTDTNSFGKFAEVLKLQINNQQFKISVESTHLGRCQLILSQTLGANTYDSVYHCTSVNNDIKQDGEVFYKLGTGVLAFRFVNDELWLRK